MRTYINFIDRFKWVVLGLTLILVLLASFKIGSLTFDGSYRIWFEKDSAILKDYDDFCGTFGNDDTILIVFSDSKSIFSAKPLHAISEVSKALRSLREIASVNSLLNYQYIYANPEDEGDIIVEDFIDLKQTNDEQYLKERENIALADTMIRNYIIDQSGNTTMIAARLAPLDIIFSEASGEKLSAEKVKALRYELVQKIKAILNTQSEKSGYHFYMSGSPVSDAALLDIASHDLSVYVPIAFLVIIVVLYLFFRTRRGILIPLLTVVLASVMTLWVYAIMGFELNNFSINIPIFITAIGIADAVHFYTAWVQLRTSGYDNKKAINMTFRKNLKPMVLTTLTTTIGFGSLISSDIVPMSTLGYTIALGSIMALVLTFVLMPAILLSVARESMPRPIRTVRCWLQEIGYSDFVVKHDIKIAVFALSVAFALGSGILFTKFDSNSIKYFDQDVEAYEAAYYAMDNITGPASYEIIIDSQMPDGIKSPAFLNKVAAFDKALFEAFPEVRFSSSLLDVIHRMHDVMYPEHPQGEIVGSSQNVNAQYLLIYTLSLPQGMEINDKLDITQRYLRYTVQADIVNSSRSLEIIAWCESWWAKEGLSAKLNGQVSMFAKMQDMVSKTLTHSLSQALIIIAILVFLVIRNIRLMVVFLVPNVMPLMMSLGFMGWMGIPINVGIAVASVIVVGLAVDDTIYFFNKFSEARKMGYSPVETFDYILVNSGSAMVFTTLILSATFSVFLLSDFMPNVHFAIMTISTMFLALFADLLLTPALISVMAKLTLHFGLECKSFQQTPQFGQKS